MRAETVLITGASSGIGEATALACVQAGAKARGDAADEFQHLLVALPGELRAVTQRLRRQTCEEYSCGSCGYCTVLGGLFVIITLKCLYSLESTDRRQF